MGIDSGSGGDGETCTVYGNVIIGHLDDSAFINWNQSFEMIAFEV